MGVRGGGFGLGLGLGFVGGLRRRELTTELAGDEEEEEEEEPRTLPWPVNLEEEEGVTFFTKPFILSFISSIELRL